MGAWVVGCPTPELHGGTVTFLFTDIEGSTRLLKQLGGGYAELLAEQARILRAAFAAHGGQEVDNQGDSFFVAFRTAKDAVAAAVDAQRDLQAQPWPEGAEVKVRMGLHTGEPKVGVERYVGIGVHRAARIGDAGHGGQVLLSSTTKELAEEDLPPGVTIRDLGERRLKDLDQRQRLYQLEIDGLPSDFKALRTLDVELKRKRRRMYAGSALIGVAAAAIAIPIFALGQRSPGGVAVAPNSVAVIDPHTNRVTNDISVGTRPSQIVTGFGSVWVANLDDGTVSRIGTKTQRKLHDIPINVEPTGLAAGDGKIWFASSGRNLPNGYTKIRLGRIDPVFNTPVGTIEPKHLASYFGGGAGPMAVGRDGVWVTSGDGVVSIDPASGQETKTDAETAWYSALTAIALGPDATWVSDGGLNRVLRIDPAGVLLTSITVGSDPSAIAAAGSAVWVVDTGADDVRRIDASANAVTNTIKVGRTPAGVAVGAGAVWVTNSGDGTISRINPQTNEVTRIEVGGTPTGIVVADGLVWVSVQAAAAGETRRRGGTVRVSIPAGQALTYTDPALDFSGWYVQQATCAPLVGYPDRRGAAGSQLVPEVARSLPHLSADRRTYTFRIRPGFRFSPPSGEPVTAATFKDSIERSLDPRMNGPAAPYLIDVVGVKAFTAGKTRHVTGIRATGDTLSFRLTGVSGSFLSRLAMPFFCPVPRDTPISKKGLPTIPSAGPYYAAAYQPNRRVILKRNPNYAGPRPHRLGEIDIALNVGEAQAVKEVEAGSADYVTLLKPSQGETARLSSRYGPESQLGRAGKQRYFVSPGLSIVYYALNTSRPLFASARMRRAVNFAVDRPALANAQQSAFGFGAVPTDQYLQPLLAGFKDAHIYPLAGPDLARARRLAGNKQRTAVLYTCDYSDCLQQTQVLVNNLAAIGIHVEVHSFPGYSVFTKEAAKGAPFDIGYAYWGSDGYFDPFDYLNILFDGKLKAGDYITPDNLSHFDDPVYDRRLKAAAKLTGAARYRTYARLDADLARKAAPILIWGNGASRDLFSTRMGCQIYRPRIDLAALCIRAHAQP